MAFFIPSLGYRVCASENPITNYNSICAVRTLDEALGGVIDITPADLDGQFDPPERSYGLTFLMGVLHHRKNPYRVLEVLSRHAEYAVISTSVTSRTFGRITLSACANGFDLQPECFSVPGTQAYRRTLAGVPMFGGEIRIDFSLDRALPPDSTDPRERGIVVQDLRLVPGTGGGYGGR